jgi:hypothetical protein
MGRANGWVNFGRIQVSEGDELVVVVENRADPAGSVLARITAGARFYPLQCPV